MSDTAHDLRHGSGLGAPLLRGDPRRPLQVLLAGLCLVALLTLGRIGLDAYDLLLVGGADVETDPRPVTLTLGSARIAVPRNMVRDHPLVRGNREELSLRVHWPTMEGYTEGRSLAFRSNDERSTILYATLRPAAGALSPQARRDLVYPRLLDGQSSEGPSGLVATRFRAGFGYDGEVLYASPDPATPFAARCAESGDGVPPTCIVEFRTADGIDVLYRFRRHLLARWSAVDADMRRLVASFARD